MLDFAWNEILLIGVVALVVVGPKDLPVVLKTAGRWAGRARNMARDFRAQVDSAIREAELEDLRKTVHEVGTIHNPLAELDRPIEIHAAPETKIPEAPQVPPTESLPQKDGAVPKP